MPVFKYKALNESGKSVEGIIDADSSRAAVDKLKRTGVYLSEIEEIEKKKARRSFQFFKRVSVAELSLTTRQFSTLISAGLPLESALSALSEQADDKMLSEVLASVKDSINEGSALAKALGDHPQVFSDLYVNIVRAGEVSGSLDVVLLRLADFLEKQAALTSKVRGALIYPAFMVLVGSGVLFIMMTFVVPKITKIFETSQKALPTLTVILIDTSHFLSDNIIIMLLVLAATVYGIYRFNQTPKGKSLIDRLVLRLPTFGKIIRMVIIARFSRTLGTLLSSGIPLLDALDVSAEVVGNSVYRDAVLHVRENVKEGTSFAGPLKETGVFPPMVTSMVSVGEQTGEMEEMLNRVANTYEQQVDTAVSALTSLLEPLMILTLGVIVGFIVFAILMPIIELTSIIG